MGLHRHDERSKIHKMEHIIDDIDKSMRHFDIAQLRKIEYMENNIRRILQNLNMSECGHHSVCSSISSLHISSSLLNDSCSKDDFNC